MVCNEMITSCRCISPVCCCSFKSRTQLPEIDALTGDPTLGSRPASCDPFCLFKRIRICAHSSSILGDSCLAKWKKSLEPIIYSGQSPLVWQSTRRVGFNLEELKMSKRKKKCVGKNATRSRRENERKLLQQVGSRESKLKTGLTALAEVSRIAYYWSLILSVDMSTLMHWLTSFITWFDFFLFLRAI